VGPGTCPACGRQVDELHHSTAAGGVCCERCHCAAAPPASLEARRYRHRPPTVKPPGRTPYQRLHDRVWRALAGAGEVFPACDGTGRMAGWCPVCRTGVLVVQLIDVDPPRWRTEGCSAGCTFELIEDVL
jgi:hypothetical protein